MSDGPSDVTREDVGSGKRLMVSDTEIETVEEVVGQLMGHGSCWWPSESWGSGLSWSFG